MGSTKTNCFQDPERSTALNPAETRPGTSREDPWGC